MGQDIGSNLPPIQKMYHASCSSPTSSETCNVESSEIGKSSYGVIIMHHSSLYTPLLRKHLRIVLNNYEICFYIKSTVSVMIDWEMF